jgi:trimethylamine---corrinoid protein Co-methyltransferase
MPQAARIARHQMAFEVLSPDQVSELLLAAYTILEQVGCKVQHAEALKMLKDHGARVDDEVVRIPRHLVQACVAAAPKGIVIFDRKGEPALQLHGRNTYFGTSTASPNNMDARTGEVRPTTLKDIERAARVADALPHIDWVMPFGSAQDVPGEIAEVYEFDAVVRHTTKPIVFCGYSGKGVARVYEMAAVVAGGMDALAAKPFVVAYPEPITPLTYPFEVVERILVAADRWQPQIPTGTQQPGATAPITLAGALAQGAAESLMAVVLVQLRQKGAPVFMACNFGGFNMDTGIMSIVPPESSLGLAAQAQLAQAVGLPTWGLAGGTDSKLIDAQAGAESAFSLLAQALAGLNLIHDVGYMDMGMCCSCDMLVLGDELIGWVRRFLRGIPLDDAAIGLDVIRRVGPGGNYLMQKQTLNLFRDEYWRPALFSREGRAAWVKKGSVDLRARVHAKVIDLLDHHTPEALPTTVADELQRIIARVADR